MRQQRRHRRLVRRPATPPTHLDRLTSITRGSDVLGYAYDASSNLTQRSYPGAVVSDLAYDNDGRLQTVTNSGLATTYGYDQASNLLTTTVPSGNGHVETRTYDRAGRLTTVLNKKNTTTLSQYVLTLDKDGNPSKIVRSGTPAETRTYKYDGLERLTEVCFQAAACTAGTSPFIRWTYDPVGNRLTEARPSVATTNYTYDNADRLLTAGATSYTFDLNGNQTGAGTRTFTYDLANRLKTTTLSATTTTYTYDGLGKRLKASTGAAANQNTNYLWDPSTPRVPEVALERDGANALLRRYQYGWDTISMAAPTSLYYFHYDNLGSMSNLTSTNGAKQWTYVYEPYGAVKTETKNNASAPPNFLKFTGEYFDPTGLYHLRARQYDPATGRFGARDPLPTAASAYTYVGNRPAVLVDPSGLAGEPPHECGSPRCWLSRILGNDPEPPDTCGSFECWVASHEGRKAISCATYAASVVGTLGEGLVYRESVGVLRGALSGKAQRLGRKELEAISKVGTIAGGGYAVGHDLFGGCSTAELIEHIPGM